MWWILMGCMGASPEQALEEGRWTLSGEEVYGFLQVDAGSCEMALWAEGFHTEKGATPCLTTVEKDGNVGVSFSMEMGAGTAQAYGELSAEKSELRLPLGSRNGDFEIALRVEKGAPDEERLAKTQQASEESLLRSRELWDESVFRLVRDERLVGELFLPDRGQAQIQLYAPEWMTSSRVPVVLAEKGPDLWLTFEVMPSLEGEQGLLIVNRPTNGAVFPIGEEPVPGEIRLALQRGRVEESQRSQHIDEALKEGVAREKAVIRPQIEQLYEDLIALECPSWEVLETTASFEKRMLHGYRAVSTKKEGACRLSVEPQVVQHGRRMSFRVESEGQIQEVMRSIFFE